VLKISFLLAKIARSGSMSQRHRSEDPDPDPPQNIMDPQHWLTVMVIPICIFIRIWVGITLLKPVLWISVTFWHGSILGSVPLS